MPKKLLLADDSITIQKVIGITFANEEFALATVDNGTDAIATARRLKPDLILADVVMPGKNGYEVCEYVKHDPELRNTPVLLLAGTFESFDEAEMARVGADGYVTKPFESQALIDKVHELIARAQSGQSGRGTPQAPAPTPASASEELNLEDFSPFEEMAPADPAAPASEPAAGEDAWDLSDFEPGGEAGASWQPGESGNAGSEETAFGGDPAAAGTDATGLEDEPLMLDEEQAEPAAGHGAGVEGDALFDFGDPGARPPSAGYPPDRGGRRSAARPADLAPMAPAPPPFPPRRAFGFTQPLGRSPSAATPGGKPPGDPGRGRAPGAPGVRAEPGLRLPGSAGSVTAWGGEEGATGLDTAGSAAGEDPFETGAAEEAAAAFAGAALAGDADDVQELTDFEEVTEADELPPESGEVAGAPLVPAGAAKGWEVAPVSDLRPGPRPAGQAPAQAPAGARPPAAGGVKVGALATRIQAAAERLATQAGAGGYSGLSPEQVEAIVSRVAREVIEEVAWEVVPDLCEALIQEEIRKITASK